MYVMKISFVGNNLCYSNFSFRILRLHSFLFYLGVKLDEDNFDSPIPIEGRFQIVVHLSRCASAV